MDTITPQYTLHFQSKIIQRSQVLPTECGCLECQKMCHTAPCLGTPFDMYLIQQEPEYKDKVALTMNMIAPRLGLPPLVMTAPIFDKQKGHCAFLENGKCVLHERGLKPIEGKLASCKFDPNFVKATKLILESWLPLQSELYPTFMGNQHV
ncbi:hypothetical protein [Runella sp.]|uniref:hypothetical protein n=1 Tax=Runella sp. TaxID=1960881 RepID=UPI003D0CBE98